jgi:glycosyltransferase involved in cell wall biosynthesis
MQLGIRWVDGLVVLTRHVITDFAGKIPALVVEGSISVDPLEPEGDEPLPREDCCTANRIVMYSGNLAGLDLLLEAFALISDPSYRLVITGRGPMEGAVRSAATRDDRIVYLGMLSTEELLRKMREATVLVIPRSASTPFIKYSFPSKLLEYMITGRPVVTTVLPGIPDEYHKYLFLLREESPNSLAELLKNICLRPSAENDLFGQRAKNFVVREKNFIRQGQKIFEFMQEH